MLRRLMMRAERVIRHLDDTFCHRYDAVEPPHPPAGHIHSVLAAVINLTWSQRLSKSTSACLAGRIAY